MNGTRAFNWRIGFAAICVLYTVWVVYLGLGNFAKVHGEYRRTKENLQPARTGAIARQELIDDCRRAARRAARSWSAGDAAPALTENDCDSFPTALVEQRKEAVTAQLQMDEIRFRRKLMVFYATFGLVFIALPLACLYLFLSLLIWVFRDMKFVK